MRIKYISYFLSLSYIEQLSLHNMPLIKNMNRQQIEDYLLCDLRVSILNDVSPCLRRRSVEGGYFAVPPTSIILRKLLGNLKQNVPR